MIILCGYMSLHMCDFMLVSDLKHSPGFSTMKGILAYGWGDQGSAALSPIFDGTILYQNM